MYYGAWGEFGASAISVQNDYQGILQEQIKESNKAYETAGEKIRAYQNSLVGMGSSAVQSGASMGEVLEIIESFSNVADSLGSQTEFIFMSAAEQALYLANAEKLAKEQFDALTGVIAQSQMESSLQRMGEAAIRSNAAFEEVSAIIANANAAVEELRSDPEWINKSTFEQFSDMNKITADTQRQLDDLTDSPYEITLNTKGNALEFLEDVEGMLLRLSGDGLGIAGALDLQGQAEGFVVAMNQLRLPEDVKALLFAQEEGRLGNLADALVPPSAAELAREAKQAADEAKRAYEQWYDALKSDAETAVLSGLQVKKEDFLPGYEDAPLEAVRRLRDIVNKGLDSPWAEYFEIPPEVLAQGEDAVKRWASDLADRGADLRDINLIDKDAFLRELEELKLARQERANVISQLVQWAIDAGLADNEKEAQSLAKDYLGEPTADGLVEGLEDEMEDYKFAKFITSAMDTDLEKNVEKYKTSGRNIANAMFGGWEEQMNENIGGYQYSDPNDAPPDGGLPSQYNIPIGRGGPLR